MSSKENIIILFCIIIAIIILLFSFKTDLFIPLVFSLIVLVFFLEKISLGESLKLSYLTIPSFFLLFYIILMALPCFAHFSLMKTPIRNTYFLAIQSVLITFPLGVCLANFFTKKPAVIIKNFLQEKITKTPTDKKLISILLILFLSAIPIIILYYLFVEHIQLFEALKSFSSKVDVVDLRFAQKTAPDLIQGLFELLRRLFLPLCVLYFFFIAFLYKKKWEIVVLIFFILSLLVSSLTLDRAEPVALFIMMALAYLLAKNMPIHKIITPKLLIIILLAIVAGALISIYQYQGTFSLARLINNIKYVFWNRIVLDPSFMASWAFRDFPGPLFLSGGSTKLLSLLTGATYNPIYPAGFVGDLWRNFGWPGIITGSIILGFVFQLIQLKLFKNKNLLTLSLYVILMINTIWLIFGHILGTISVAIFVLSLLLLLWSNLIYSKSSSILLTSNQKIS